MGAVDGTRLVVRAVDGAVARCVVLSGTTGAALGAGDVHGAVPVAGKAGDRVAAGGCSAVVL